MMRRCRARGLVSASEFHYKLSREHAAVQIELYKAAGRDRANPDFSVDDMILSGAR